MALHDAFKSAIEYAVALRAYGPEFVIRQGLNQAVAVPDIAGAVEIDQYARILVSGYTDDAIKEYTDILAVAGFIRDKVVLDGSKLGGMSRSDAAEAVYQLTYDIGPIALVIANMQNAGENQVVLDAAVKSALSSQQSIVIVADREDKINAMLEQDRTLKSRLSNPIIKL